MSFNRGVSTAKLFGTSPARAPGLQSNWPSRTAAASAGRAKQRQDNLYAGVDYPDRGGSFVETYYIRDADMNLARIPAAMELFLHHDRSLIKPIIYNDCI